MSKSEKSVNFPKVRNPFINFFVQKFPALTTYKESQLKSHRNISEQRYGYLKVMVIPIKRDNYSYLLIDMGSKVAFAVDPGEFNNLVHMLENEDLTLHAVLSTHHHSDHVSANKGLYERDNELRIYGGDSRIPYVTDIVEHKSTFQVGRTTIECINTPCHTRGHMSYYIKPQRRGLYSVPGLVFTGDSLFVGGCGKAYKGKVDAMQDTFERLSRLPPTTLLFCGHEYTIANLKFAQKVEPDNEDIAQKLEWALMKKEENEPTVPSTIDDEKKTNPFMRVDMAEVQKYTKSDDSETSIKLLRRKNRRFRE